MAFLESLESRLFMSVTPAQVAAAVKVVRTAEASVSADLAHLERQGLSDFAVIVADVRHLGAKIAKSEKSFVPEFDDAGSALVSPLEKGERAGAALINRDIAALIAAEKKLAKTPTSTTFQALVQADNTKLTTDANTLITGLEAHASTTGVDDVLNEIALANSSDAKIGTAVETAETDISNNLSAAGTAAQTLYMTDVTALQSLFGP